MNGFNSDGIVAQVNVISLIESKQKDNGDKFDDIQAKANVLRSIVLKKKAIM